MNWVHNGEHAVLYVKGEGVSLMGADIFSANYGWLQSQYGSQQAWVLFKASKAQDGYFTNDNILQNNYQSQNHVLVFDNMTTHLKWVDIALSTCKMPKNTLRHGQNWGMEVVVLNGDGKPVFDLNGKVWHQKVHMGDAMFANGGQQHL